MFKLIFNKLDPTNHTLASSTVDISRSDTQHVVGSRTYIGVSANMHPNKSNGSYQPHSNVDIVIKYQLVGPLTGSSRCDGPGFTSLTQVWSSVDAIASMACGPPPCHVDFSLHYSATWQAQHAFHHDLGDTSLALHASARYRNLIMLFPHLTVPKPPHNLAKAFVSMPDTFSNHQHGPWFAGE